MAKNESARQKEPGVSTLRQIGEVVAVYVDPLMAHGWIMRGRSVSSCHLFADTLDELHTFAERIGMKRLWFQPGRRDHYDLTQSKRALAVLWGAVELNDHKSLSEFMKRTRPKRKRIAKEPVRRRAK